MFDICPMFNQPILIMCLLYDLGFMATKQSAIVYTYVEKMNYCENETADRTEQVLNTKLCNDTSG